MEAGFFTLGLADRQDTFEEDYPSLDAGGKLAYIANRDVFSGDVLTRFSRYEARLERSFYRALHELQRLRAQRPPVPEARTEKVANQTQFADLPGYRVQNTGLNKLSTAAVPRRSML